jgi:hypothetical protein
MIVADNVTPLAPGDLKGLGFLADTAEEAGQVARGYLGMTALMN